jgi:2-polyprenyl-3-methyl-5-hydroxy-6-metoxy-1,4-benzoquinol methylase
MRKEGYEEIYDFERTHWWFKTRRTLFLSQVTRAVDELKGGRARILDFGCGTGFNFRFLKEHGDVTGADLYVDRIREYQKDEYELIDLQQDLDPHYGQFDIVTALDVIEHAEDDLSVLNDVWRLLSESGQLIITVPAYQWLWSGEDIISEHQRRYTIPMLRELISQTEFRIQFISHFNLSILPGMAFVIFAKKILMPETAKQEGNVGPVNPLLNGILSGITNLENSLVGSQRIRLPAGPSIVCRLSKNC